MKTVNAPIGFFDSGVGGTSIWKEVIKLLPHEHTIYLADSAHAPYGKKSQEEIIELSIKNTDYLIARGCKMIVIPCNTATTNAILYLRDHYKIPFIGIEPAIKPAALNSRTKTIGVLATQGTLSSALFQETQSSLQLDIKFIEVVGTGIVELIESGKKDSLEMLALLTELVQPFIENKIDYLVLGCSHYPYIKIILQELLGRAVTIIDSGEAVARQTLSILKSAKLLNTSTAAGEHKLFSNSDKQVLQHIIGDVENAVVLKEDF